MHAFTTSGRRFRLDRRQHGGVLANVEPRRVSDSRDDELPLAAAEASAFGSSAKSASGGRDVDGRHADAALKKLLLALETPQVPVMNSVRLGQ